MSAVVSHPVAVQWRSRTVLVALTCAAFALSVVLVVAPMAGRDGAVGTIGIVLVEAIALHLGYGVLTRIAFPSVRGFLVSD